MPRTPVNAKTFKLSELARLIGAELRAPRDAADLDIRGVATLDQAGPDQLTFLTNPRFASKAATTRAAAIIVAAPLAEVDKPQLVSSNPYAAMAKASQRFYERRHTFSGQSELAYVHPSAEVDESATLYPFAFVDQGAKVGPGCVLYPHSYVGIDAVLGARCVLYPAAVVMETCKLASDVVVHGGAVLGADGFGYAPTREGIEKIPQIGGLVVGEACEIGSTSSVNRGAFEDTTLGKGVKLDSHVHIAHGVGVGDFSMVCGLAGIAGSAKVGKRYIGAGQSGVAPGVEAGDNVTLGAQSGLIVSVSEKGEYLGFPAVPAAEWRRQTVSLGKLPELLKTVRKLEQRIAELEKRGD